MIKAIQKYFQKRAIDKELEEALELLQQLGEMRKEHRKFFEDEYKALQERKNELIEKLRKLK